MSFNKNNFNFFTKRHPSYLKFLLLLFLPLFHNCGKEEEEEEEEVVATVEEVASNVLAMSKVYADETKAPACVEGERGNLIFLLDTKIFKYCSAEDKYVELTIKVC